MFLCSSIFLLNRNFLTASTHSSLCLVKTGQKTLTWNFPVKKNLETLDFPFSQWKTEFNKKTKFAKFIDAKALFLKKEEQKLLI